MTRKSNFRLHFLNAVLTLCCGLSYSSFTCIDSRPYEFNGFAQGTSYHIVYYAPDSTVGKGQFDNIFSNIDSSLSIYKPYSLINRFNQSDSGVNTDQHLRTVVKKSLAVFQDSDGLFDVTIFPIVQAWGFGNISVTALPDSDKIKSLMNCVGSRKIYLDHNYLGKSIPCVQIDVNGIAQGYTVDVMADFLERNNIHNYLVEVGGEIRAKGYKEPGHETMRIGIESPSNYENGEPEMKRIITLREGAVTTSGNYRKQRKVNNRIISHLMNPKTGYPIQNDMISATVVAKDAITADGYDNVLMGLGHKAALLFMDKHRDMEAYLIYYNADGSLGETATPGFYKLIQD